MGNFPLRFAQTYDLWSADVTYSQGDKVQYDGKSYQAIWPEQGEVPGASPYNEWMEIGVTVITSMGPVPTWTTSWVYDTGDLTYYQGQVYTCQWWNRDVAPDTPNGPWTIN